MSFCCLSKTTGAHFFQKNCLGGGEGGGGVSKIVLTRQNMSLIYFATIPYPYNLKQTIFKFSAVFSLFGRYLYIWESQ